MVASCIWRSSPSHFVPILYVSTEQYSPKWMLVPVDSTESASVQSALASANRRASPVELRISRYENSDELL